MPFEKLVPVDAHLQGMCWQRFKDYSFAKGDLGKAIVAAEAGLVASFAPFLFQRTGDEYIPYALFSLSGTGNAFVSPDGVWKGTYVPARMRSDPFYLMGRGYAAIISVRNDAILKHSNGASENLPFLTETGNLTPPIRQVFRFLKQLEEETEKTQRLMMKVARMGLLKQYEHRTFTRNDRNQLFIVDFKKVHKNKEIQEFISKDVSLHGLLQAHAISLAQVNRLHAAEANRAATGHGHITAPKDVSGFLSALGDALELES
ncbi:SapC family protein [uncultured Tateyamaria sp.]|uniref:SapC family protein n=1 Tax=uncultured Tateyamaria sp. TaxID=455651 RepID=UPI0026368D04|nr:SapC family protein [uncultured Tateyamaria sp.]